MTIHVNGQPTTYPDGTTILRVLEASNLTPDKVAVELNRRLVRTAHYDQPLKDNDQLEIVTFVGGGC